MAGWQAALAARFGVHYGWVVVAVTLPTLLVAAGLRASPGVIIRPWEAEFGWDRAAISTIIAVSWIAYGIASPLAGRFLDTLGPRRVTLASIGLATAGAIATVLVREPWQLYLVWGVAVGLGAGGAANVLAATVANRWFATKRGLVTGILGGGSSAGQLIFLPTLMALTISDGWRSGLILLAALLGFLIIPLVYLFLRDSPAEVGLRPFGAGSATGSSASAAGGAVRATPVREAIRTTDFWFLAGSFFICGYTTNGLIGTHLIPHAVEHGIPEVTTASVLGLMGMMNILGTIASGMLVDRFDARRMLAAYYAFRGLSLFLLPFVQDAGMLSVFAVIYGLDWLATVPPTINLTADRFGRGSVGSIYGWISLSHQLGGALAAAMGGFVYVMLGSYNAAFISAGVTAVIAAGLALGVRRTRLPVPARGAGLRPAAAAGASPAPASERYLLAVLGASLAVQTGASLGHQSLAPLAPFLQTDLQLSRAAFGLLTTAATLGACLSNVPAGRLCDRLGVRPLFLLGPAGVGAALLLGAALGSYGGLLALLLLSGLSNGLALPPTTRAIVDWFPTRRRALAMGIKQTGVALAGTLTALAAPPLALAFGWQGALAAIGVATAVAGLAGFLVYRDRPVELAVSRGPRPSLGALLGNRDLMLLCGATLLLAGVQLSLVNFLVLFLHDALDYSVAAAGPLLALAQLSGVVGRVGWGLVSDRWFGGERRPVIRLIAGLAALGALGLSAVDAAVPGAVLAGLVVLAGGSAIGWNGVNMTFVAELAGRQQSASAAGLNLTSSGIGILFAPPLFGALVDATGSYPLGFQCLAGAALGAVLLVQLIRSRPPV